MSKTTEKENTYELLYLSRQGSQTAYEALFKKYYRHLYLLVLECVANDARYRSYQDDIMIEACIAFNEAVETYRDDQNVRFVTFLSVVAGKRVSNALRRIAIAHRQFGDFVSLDQEIGRDENLYAVKAQRDCFNDPEYVMNYHAAQERLNDTLHSLNEAELAAARSWMIGESYREGAERNGIALKTWEGRRLRVRKKICKSVKDE